MTAKFDAATVEARPDDSFPCPSPWCVPSLPFCAVLVLFTASSADATLPPSERAVVPRCPRNWVPYPPLPLRPPYPCLVPRSAVRTVPRVNVTSRTDDARRQSHRTSLPGACVEERYHTIACSQSLPCRQIPSETRAPLLPVPLHPARHRRIQLIALLCQPQARLPHRSPRRRTAALSSRTDTARYPRACTYLYFLVSIPPAISPRTRALGRADS
ncbi:hypothetical protein B0H17DRAFT_372608 [Mycena rosella]|uniref:Uncharacterized protein n=1 Tax=Mycena rosella TaxID=1033263 RepID=A0AAD7GPB6_MYCRO|nr:hypothetical protein B0H17DRAFT_372608 [Mycena rosella]